MGTHHADLLCTLHREHGRTECRRGRRRLKSICCTGTGRLHSLASTARVCSRLRHARAAACFRPHNQRIPIVPVLGRSIPSPMNNTLDLAAVCHEKMAFVFPNTHHTTVLTSQIITERTECGSTLPENPRTIRAVNFCHINKALPPVLPAMQHLT